MQETEVTVTVTEQEGIVPRGHQRISWFLRDGERWCPIARAPNASVLSRDAPPGVVWQRQVELRLPVGARLLRVWSEPAAPARRDPFDYLRRETRLVARTVSRREFVVGRRGELE